MTLAILFGTWQVRGLNPFTECVTSSTDSFTANLNVTRSGSIDNRGAWCYNVSAHSFNEQSLIQYLKG